MFSINMAHIVMIRKDEQNQKFTIVITLSKEPDIFLRYETEADRDKLYDSICMRLNQYKGCMYGQVDCQSRERCAEKRQEES